MSAEGVAAAYAELRPLLFAIAYRMLGSVGEAEDVVQEAFVRYQRAHLDDRAAIVSPRAYLSAVTTRLAIDQLRSARVRRAAYPGPWLPEPLIASDVSGALDAAQVVEDAETISMAFLLVLERLSPVERAVFLLHDVFDYGYDEIGSFIGKSEQNCRQLAVRARRHVRENRPRFEPTSDARNELAHRFFAAARGGDVDALVSVLAADVAVYGDGGGRAPSWTHPIEGRDRVIRLLLGLARWADEVQARAQLTEVNGQPGAMFFDRDGRLINVMSLELSGGRVRALRSVINPDKLRHLGALADVPALFGQRGGQ